MPDEPTVFVVDDDPAVRDSLVALMESVHLRSQAFATGRDFLDRADPCLRGCLVLDIRMPGVSGLELLEELRRRQAQLPVIIITAHGDMQIGVSAMKAGAIDCLAKPFHDQELLDRIHQALARDARARADRARRDEISARIARLSRRERQVLEGVVAGKTSRNIAEELGVTTKTVDAHRANMMDKMCARSLAELVQLAVRAGELN